MPTGLYAWLRKRPDDISFDALFLGAMPFSRHMLPARRHGDRSHSSIIRFGSKYARIYREYCQPDTCLFSRGEMLSIAAARYHFY